MACDVGHRWISSRIKRPSQLLLCRHCSSISADAPDVGSSTLLHGAQPQQSPSRCAGALPDVNAPHKRLQRQRNCLGSMNQIQRAPWCMANKRPISVRKESNPGPCWRLPSARQQGAGRDVHGIGLQLDEFPHGFVLRFSTSQNPGSEHKHGIRNPAPLERWAFHGLLQEVMAGEGSLQADRCQFRVPCRFGAVGDLSHYRTKVARTWARRKPGGPLLPERSAGDSQDGLRCYVAPPRVGSGHRTGEGCVFGRNIWKLAHR